MARLRSPPPPPPPPPSPVWPNVSISSFKAPLFFFLSATTAAIGSLGRDCGGLILIGRRRYNWSRSCAVTRGRDSVSHHRRRRPFVFYRIRYQICWRSDGRRCRRTTPKSLCSGRQTDISSRRAPCQFVRLCCLFVPGPIVVLDLDPNGCLGLRRSHEAQYPRSFSVVMQRNERNQILNLSLGFHAQKGKK